MSINLSCVQLIIVIFASIVSSNQFDVKCNSLGLVYKPNSQTTCICSSTVLYTSICKAPLPLDPLNDFEIRRTKNILNNYLATRSGPGFVFNLITLKEPPKNVILPYFLNGIDPPANAYPRKSLSIVAQKITGKTYEAIVNLNSGVVENFSDVNVEPSLVSLNPDLVIAASSVVQNDPRVAARCANAGYPNMTLCQGDAFPPGYIQDNPAYAGKNLLQFYMYGRNFPEDNMYAHPLDFAVVVDVNQSSVIAIENLPTHNDFNANNTIGNIVPRAERNYDYTLRGGRSFLRKDDKPIIVESPNGPSYKVNGSQIEWQKWRFRLGCNAREGIVFYLVNYNDNGTVRPIMYRMALSEMYIPYGDPRPPYHRKTAFDEGLGGLGFLSDSQANGKDVIGNAKLFSYFFNNSTGDPVLNTNIISIREEDAGILWKHVDYSTGKSIIVRSHRLVLSHIATVGNYEYIYIWQFYQDGSIRFEVQLTGILSVNLLAVNATPAGYGSTIAPSLNAQYHQHFFAVRMDTEIDGNANSVQMQDVVSLPDPTGSPGNPYGQGFTVKTTPLNTSGDARTKINPENARVWIVTNDNKKHPYTGQAVGWKLVPGGGPPLKMNNDSPIRAQVGFLDYNIWVTAYNDDQLYAGGYFLNNSGLPVWVGTSPMTSVRNTDIVLWHILGVAHIPRVEDFPVMPVESTGFWFKPCNFFLENPAIDVPPAGIKIKSEL